MAFEALYTGTCPSCDEPIYIGDSLAWAYDDGDRVVIHADCHAKPRKPAEVCPTCWLEKPCGCDD